MSISRSGRAARVPLRTLLLGVFWVAFVLTCVALAMSWALVFLDHFGDITYNPLWLPLAAFLLLPSGGLWTAVWLIRNPAPASPRR